MIDIHVNSEFFEKKPFPNKKRTLEDLLGKDLMNLINLLGKIINWFYEKNIICNIPWHC